MELSREDWLKIAQFKAVTLTMHVLSQTTQSQIPGEIAYSWYYEAEFHACLSTNKKIKFIDTSNSYPCTMPRDKLPLAELEIVKLQQETRQLIVRLLKELDHYFKKPDSDQMISMNLHPIMHWSGFV